jgi:ATP-dependent DNA helicase DinG
MARLVARALRLKRSALIQTGVKSNDAQRQYRLSYLAPALIWEEPAILVATPSVQQRLLEVEIPALQKWLQTDKIIQTGDRWPDSDFQGLLLTSPSCWLADRLAGNGLFPQGILAIVDGADDLEAWARDRLTVSIDLSDWEALMAQYSKQSDRIRDIRVELTKALFSHPPNPYDLYPIEPSELESFKRLCEELFDGRGREGEGERGRDKTRRELLTPNSFQSWYEQQTNEQLTWASIARSQGQFSIYSSPVEVASTLSQVWEQQPVVLIGEALDAEPEAPVYRQQLGLGDLTYVKFSSDRQSELIQLYVPDRLPMPNTPEYQNALLQQIRLLFSICPETNVKSDPHPHPLSHWERGARQGGVRANLEDAEWISCDRQPVVIIVGDVPLKAQVAAILAAELGSQVQVEKITSQTPSILVTGWEFWRQHSTAFPAPKLLIIATLPIPSLEHPLVAGRVAYYKQLRQDWFRLYLLPSALRELQRAIAPVRESQGVVALLDSRVNYRSYGKQVLSALDPLARINYPDTSWFR